MVRGLIAVTLAAALAGFYFYYRQSEEIHVEERPRLSLTEVLSGSEEGFARAIELREFNFPQDHGLHPEFKTEWWSIPPPPRADLPPPVRQYR